MLLSNNSAKFFVASKRLIPVVLSVFLCSWAVWAQVTASITGSVKDSSGAVVPDVAVTVKNVDTGLTRTVPTDASGNYSVFSLPVGQYEITTEKTGFKEAVRKGITLVVGQQAVLNLTLEVGNVEQQVTVTGEAPLVNTTTSQTSGLVGEREVKDLPLNGRSFDQLLTLNVGTANYATGSSTYAHTGNVFSVSGHRPETNRFLMNGIDYIGTDSSSQVSSPTGAAGELMGVDAIREFNVVEDTYGAEYGRRAGGQISVVTMSGTNALHGSMFEFLRNSDLDGRNFFDYPLGERIPPFRRNQFGGSVGGPLKKDKLFLFGNYEGLRQRLGLSNVAIVPDKEADQGLYPVNGVYATAPNLAPAMLPYLNAYWPAQNGPELLSTTGLPTGAAYNYSNPGQRIREDYGLVRMDYNASEKNMLSVNFMVDNGENDSPSKDSNFIAISPQDTYLAGFQETHIFSSTFLSVFNLGFSRAYTSSVTLPNASTGASVPASLYLISGTVPGIISIGGGLGPQAATFVQAGGSATLAIARNLFTGSDDLHLTKGNHSLSVGVWVQRSQLNMGGSPLANSGQASFPSLLGILQDTITTFIGVPNQTALGYRTTLAAWYVQDEIKLKPNLTVRLGLRDEMTTGYNEASGRCANYLYGPGGVINTNPTIGSSCLSQNSAIALWQPRVGLAWDPTGSGKWAVRAGAGIYNDLQDNLAHRLNSNPPFNARLTVSGGPLLSFVPIQGGTQPPPSCTVVGQTGCSTFSPGDIDPDMHTPTIQEWSFSVEREITKNLMVHLGYTGYQGYHMPINVNENESDPQICQTPAGCPSGGVSGAVGLAPQGALYLPPGSRPNPLVASTFSWWYDGVSSYNALNASLTKRFSRGLTFKANYTYGKAMDFNSAISASSGENEPQMIYDIYDLGLSRGVSAYSLRHQFNANYTYQLPFGKGQQWASNVHGAADILLSGWQWNGIFTAQSGFPFTPQTGSNRSGNGDSFTPDLPNVNPSFTGPVITGNPAQYYNPNAFLLPIAGTYGDVSRGSLQGPTLFTFDTSLFKTFKVSERFNLQFRAEFFNILNHANFGEPSPIVFSGTAFSPSAGTITSTATTSRQIQFALKLNF